MTKEDADLKLPGGEDKDTLVRENANEGRRGSQIQCGMLTGSSLISTPSHPHTRTDHYSGLPDPLRHTSNKLNLPVCLYLEKKIKG